MCYRFLSGYVVNSVSAIRSTGSGICAGVNQVLQVPVFDLHSQANQVSLCFGGVNVRFSKVSANILFRILQAGKNLN
jgi:hypothetical protein